MKFMNVQRPHPSIPHHCGLLIREQYGIAIVIPKSELCALATIFYRTCNAATLSHAPTQMPVLVVSRGNSIKAIPPETQRDADIAFFQNC